MSNVNFEIVEALQRLDDRDDYAVFRICYKSGTNRRHCFFQEEVEPTMTKAYEAGVRFEDLRTFNQLPHEDADDDEAEDIAPPEGSEWCRWCGDRPAAVGEPCEACRKLGAKPEDLEDTFAGKLTGNPVADLAGLLGLNEAQAAQLKGATRINFWRNGHLNMQISHGCSSVKIACPKAPADSDLVTLLYNAWGWSRLDENRLYFRPSKEARVTL